ncbi:MAG: hypothetical protein QM479_14945 [Pseudomonadota bacterium]
MYRRLFFLFPDKLQTQKAVDNLIMHNIHTKQMHVLSKPGVDLQGLPLPSPNQRRDMHTKIEDTLWYSNLGLFFIALFISINAYFSANYYLMVVSFIVMVLCYSMGYYYLTKPTIHLDGFHAAFAHGEILLMVDVPKNQVADIEHLVQHNSPAASEEGISWTPSDFSMKV